MFLSGTARHTPAIRTGERFHVVLATWVVEDRINQAEDVEAV